MLGLTTFYIATLILCMFLACVLLSFLIKLAGGKKNSPVRESMSERNYTLFAGRNATPSATYGTQKSVQKGLLWVAAMVAISSLVILYAYQQGAKVSGRSTPNPRPRNKSSPVPPPVSSVSEPAPSDVPEDEIFEFDEPAPEITDVNP